MTALYNRFFFGWTEYIYIEEKISTSSGPQGGCEDVPRITGILHTKALIQILIHTL